MQHLWLKYLIPGVDWLVQADQWLIQEWKYDWISANKTRRWLLKTFRKVLSWPLETKGKLVSLTYWMWKAAGKPAWGQAKRMRMEEPRQLKRNGLKALNTLYLKSILLLDISTHMSLTAYQFEMVSEISCYIHPQFMKTSLSLLRLFYLFLYDEHIFFYLSPWVVIIAVFKSLSAKSNIWVILRLVSIDSFFFFLSKESQYPISFYV